MAQNVYVPSRGPKKESYSAWKKTMKAKKKKSYRPTRGGIRL